MEAIGAVSAIIAIIELIGKSTTVLREVYDRWKDADLAILNLVAQLTALKAALNKIKEWLSSDLESTPQHHQLVLDMQLSLGCCEIAMESMYNRISQLRWTNRNGLMVQSKLKAVFEDKAIKNFQKSLRGQTDALNLLLTACNW
jgi:hypothetical protein